MVAYSEYTPGVAVGPGLAPVPARAMRMRAVLDQEDPVLLAVGGDPLHLEGDVAADVHEERRLWLVPLGLGLEVGE